nr:MAG TPA: hypothetical protein [Caudoviricetes sp.]
MSPHRRPLRRAYPRASRLRTRRTSSLQAGVSIQGDSGSPSCCPAQGASLRYNAAPRPCSAPQFCARCPVRP